MPWIRERKYGLTKFKQLLAPIAIFYSIGKRRKRSAAYRTHETQRLFALQSAEALLKATMPHMSSHDCVLRAICETAHTPVHDDGIVGEAINALLMPAHIMDRLPEYGESDYLHAQRMGHNYGNCTQYYQPCPFSFFEVGLTIHSRLNPLPKLSFLQIVDKPVSLCRDSPRGVLKVGSSEMEYLPL